LLGLLPLRSGAVLIIDEAQNLPLKVLEQLRILSNLETDKEKLLQIILVGQLNLQPLLKSPELKQLDQRVSIRYELKPLTPDEVAEYVAHRLMVAGGANTVTFLPKALDRIHRLSGGIPRLINLICDRALLGAYALHTNKVTKEIVVKAAETLDVPKPARGSRFAWFRGRARAITRVLAALVTMFLALAVVLFGLVPVTETARAGLVTPQRHAPVAAAQPTRIPARPLPVSMTLAPVVNASVLQGVAAPLPGDRPYTLFVGSYPIQGSGDPKPIPTIASRLQALGYPVYKVDVDLGQRGRWRRVLAGSYRTIHEARETETRLRSLPEFGQVRVVTSTHATSVQLARAGGVS
jgi:hypothetical protein